MKDELQQFNELDALNKAVSIAKKAATETIASPKEAHRTAYSVYLRLSQRLDIESNKYIEKVSVYQQ